MSGEAITQHSVVAAPFQASGDPINPHRHRWSEFFSRLSEMRQRPRRVILWWTALWLVLLVGYADYATGYEVSAVLFYSVPILLIVRFEDRRSGILMAVICALTWWWADEASGHNYSEIWHQTWETVVRLIYFLLFVAGGTTVRSKLELLERAQRLEREIVRISEREQRRIGQDLHDGLCQYFAAAACTAGSIKGRLTATASPEVKAVADLQTMILSGVDQARQIARGLFPVQNDEWGLPSALAELAASTTRLAGLQCSFVSTVTTVALDNVAATHLFRIAQEALNNALRHGHAETATITLLVEEKELILTITDDGDGFAEAPTSSPGLGLSIMQHRAKEMGATVTVSENADRGVTVCCRLSLV